MINSFIKKNLEIILAVVVTAIICISGTVFATGYFASDVKYKKEDGTETNVEKALNELYNKIKNASMLTILDDNRGEYEIPNGVKSSYIIYLPHFLYFYYSTSILTCQVELCYIFLN